MLEEELNNLNARIEEENKSEKKSDVSVSKSDKSFKEALNQLE